ncbi:dynamin-related protein 3A isoform X2 [Cannabis sativa]|uniref:dynamin-related protein 3A isoform X2 n=1 Tax=Cannabis sativa TaxID=3483 RepID=UPI0029CA5378|nr:dynamin-related protein 3A isoform X2 [Cannabis sativa]
MSMVEEDNTRSKAPPTIGSSLVPIINRLHEVIASVGSNLLNISLPLVAVVGSQSSGKSSALEALVGRDFLPRGCDICTRRPLLLVLENRSVSPGDDGAEWGEFRHLPGKLFYDFSKIRREIQAETDRGAGLNKGVSDKQILLKISSPKVPNMMLVDLPGITKVPVGDQPSDIEARVREMIMTQIRQEKCIILAVSPANSDLATSDALQMARDADPTGSRTIGVITKLDIMDRGTDARNFLLGKVVPLRLGYIGVINRSQEDINKNRSIADALSREEKFFRDHPVYSGLSGCCGIPQLSKKLNQILEQHIRMALPSLKSELNSKMIAVAKELQTYGNVVEANVEKGVILLNILSTYCEDFSALVDGSSQDISTKELSGGARILYIFQSIFVKSLEEVDPCEGLSDDDIRIAIQNAAGARNVLIIPEAPFEVLVRRQISRLLDPSLQCVRYVYDELIKISRACEVTDLQRFPKLRRCMDEIMVKFVRDGVKPAERMIRNLIEMEMDYINSSHPNFLGGSKAVELASEQLRSQQGIADVEKPIEKSQNSRAVITRSLGSRSSVNNEKPVSSGGNTSTRTWGISSIFGTRGSSGGNPSSSGTLGELDGSDQMPATIQLIEPPSVLRPLEATEDETVKIFATKLLIRSYYDIVRKNIQDLVPKAVMHFLVNHTKRKVQSTFIQKLYREDLFEELLLEEDEVVLKRKRNEELFKVLQEAIELQYKLVPIISDA